jgi:hypothetical protein
MVFEKLIRPKKRSCGDEWEKQKGPKTPPWARLKPHGDPGREENLVLGVTKQDELFPLAGRRFLAIVREGYRVAAQTLEPLVGECVRPARQSKAGLRQSVQPCRRSEAVLSIRSGQHHRAALGSIKTAPLSDLRPGESGGQDVGTREEIEIGHWN